MTFKKRLYDERWKEKSIEWREETPCELCGSVKNLQCHHIDYNNIGHECRQDIWVLCDHCHQKVTYRKIRLPIKTFNRISRKKEQRRIQELIRRGSIRIFNKNTTT